MKIKDNLIIDFNLNHNEEADILKCFLSENEQILFNCREYFIKPGSEVDSKRIEYIIDRTKIKSKTSLFETINYKKDEVSYWYEPRNKNELIDEIAEGYFDYACIVLGKGKEASDYKYLLRIEENYPDEDYGECRALFVKEGINSDFQNEIVPKLIKQTKKLQINN